MWKYTVGIIYKKTGIEISITTIILVKIIISDNKIIVVLKMYFSIMYSLKKCVINVLYCSFISMFLKKEVTAQLYHTKRLNTVYIIIIIIITHIKPQFNPYLSILQFLPFSFTLFPLIIPSLSLLSSPSFHPSSLPKKSNLINSLFVL